MYLLFALNCCQFSPVAVDITHNYHISRTQIEYAAEQQEWQISVHLFIDDLALALKKTGHSRLRLGSKREAIQADTLIEAYLNRYLKLKEIGGKKMPYQWIGKEMTEDLSSFWIYLNVADAPPLQGIHVENRLLTHLYDDQQNQVHIIDSAQESYQLLFNKDFWEETVLFSKE